MVAASRHTRLRGVAVASGLALLAAMAAPGGALGVSWWHHPQPVPGRVLDQDGHDVPGRPNRPESCIRPSC